MSQLKYYDTNTSTWKPVLVGAQGFQGATGPQGTQGTQGVQGTQGSTGTQGSQGSVGLTGPTGAQGAVGSNGPQGSQGFQGANGGYLTAGSYVCRAIKGGTAQTVTRAVDTIITFVDDFDPNNWYTSNQFKPTIAGYYSVYATVWWNSGTDATQQNNIQFRKNGSSFAIAQNQTVTSVGLTQELSSIVYLNGSTDYVEVTGYAGGTGSVNINGDSNGTYFTAALYAYGPQGSQGFQGSVGSTGPQGAQGLTGPTGPTGTTGPQGFQGNSITGPQGPQGYQGVTGTGYDGVTSSSTATPASTGTITLTTNKQGAFATGSRVRAVNTTSNYFEGVVTITGGTSFAIAADYNLGTTAASSWTIVDVGVRGAQGATGPQGATGAQGAAGSNGAQGATGSQGAAGTTGPTGPTGPQGSAGGTGPTGPQGSAGGTGPTGPQGSAGPSTTINATATTSATNYYCVGVATQSSAVTAYSASSIYYNASTGYLYATAMQATSDERLKKNITPVKNALYTINNFEGVKFDWTNFNKSSYGVIAQQIESVIPELVETNEETGMKSVNYDGITAFLIEAIKEQQQLIENQQQQIDALKEIVNGN